MAGPSTTLAVIGLGLLGGSLTRAAKEFGLVGRTIAVGRRRQDLEEALAERIVDSVSTNLDAIAEADWVVCCQPVDAIRDQLPEVLRCAKPGAIVTDVGSTKASIVEAAEAAPTQACFIGSHPMAGSEKTGWRHARPDLYRGATTFVTVSAQCSLAAAVRVAGFWRALGSRVVFAAPDRHDQVVALISHLPHLLAVGLVERLEQSGEDPNLLRLLAGNGLRDTTRIAAGSPEMWDAICRHNPEAIASELDAVAQRLTEMAAQLRDQCGNGAILELLQRAQQYRQGLDRTKTS